MNVFDVNDNAPEFTSIVYNAEILEDAPLMSEVLRVAARDRDSGANARIRYQIASENQLNDFGVNPTTGEVFVRKPLDRERQAEYRFLVVATDQGAVGLIESWKKLNILLIFLVLLQSKLFKHHKKICRFYWNFNVLSQSTKFN